MKKCESWSDVEQIIAPFVKSYFSMDDEVVPTFKDSLARVGNSFTGYDRVVSFQTKEGVIGEVRKPVTNGYGEAYRDRCKDGFVLGLLGKNNKWIYGPVEHIKSTIELAK